MFKNPLKGFLLNFLKQFKFKIFLLLFLIVGLGTVLILFAAYPNRFVIDRFGQRKSSVKVFLEGNKLNLVFNLEPKDKNDFNRFSQKLGVDPKVFSKISMEVDGETQGKLAQKLPVEIVVWIFNDSLNFGSSKTDSLPSAFVKSDYEFATEGAKLKFKTFSESDFELKVDNPSPIINFATVSGQLNLAKKSYSLFPILEKIARINLRVNGKNVSGEIKLY